MFERSDANWIDVLPTITKQHNIRVHSSTKLTRIQASVKRNEGYVCKNLLDKRKKVKPKFQVNDLVRTADLKKKRFQKVIQPIGLINCIKSRKSVMIQYQVIVLTFYENVITKLY